MAESEPIPIEVNIYSEESDSNSDIEASLGLIQGTVTKEVFQAAQHISSQGNIEAAFERKKKQQAYGIHSC